MKYVARETPGGPGPESARVACGECREDAVEGCLSLLRRVCQLHVEAGILTANPCLGSGRVVAKVARRFEHTSREIDAWTHEEARILLQLAEKNEKNVRGPLLCALHTGMRRGELSLGLDWKDVGKERIVVRRALVRGSMTTTKNGRSRECVRGGHQVDLPPCRRTWERPVRRRLEDPERAPEPSQFT